MTGVVLLIVSSAIADVPATGGYEASCGPYCLYVALKALDLVTEPYSSFEKKIDPVAKEGYSLRTLERLAARFGAHTLAVEADLGTLGRVTGRRACIALLDKHYVVIKQIDSAKGRIAVIDPPREFEQSFERFRRAFSGRALIVATGPISLPGADGAWRIGASVLAGVVAVIGFGLIAKALTRRKSATATTTAAACLIVIAQVGCGTAKPGPTNAVGPAELRIEPAEHHAGKVFLTSTEQTLSLRTWLSNDSDTPIHVREVRRSCSCTSIAMDATTIPPRGRVSLKADFALGIKPGPNRVTITVVTSGSAHSERDIAYDWDLVTPLYTRPDRLQSGRVDPAQPLVSRLELRNRGLKLCGECRLQASADRRSIEARIENVPTPIGSTGHDVLDPSAGETSVGTLVVTIQPGEESGDFSQDVEVGLKCGEKERTRLLIPVDWSVRPSVEIHPPRLWLGFARPGETLTRRVMVKANDGQVFRLGGAAAKPGLLGVRSTFPSEAEVETPLDLAITAPTQPGVHRGGLDVTIGRDRDFLIHLPISVIIKPD